ncbi:MAG: class I adenylate-forming enzyme family protein [Acidimicrobiia bacterium]
MANTGSVFGDARKLHANHQTGDGRRVGLGTPSGCAARHQLLPGGESRSLGEAARRNNAAWIAEGDLPEGCNLECTAGHGCRILNPDIRKESVRSSRLYKLAFPGTNLGGADRDGGTYTSPAFRNGVVRCDAVLDREPPGAEGPSGVGARCRIGRPVTATAFQRLQGLAASRPGATAITAGSTPGQTMTFRDLAATTDRMRDGLFGAGVRDGDAVVLVMDRSAQAISALLAIMASGMRPLALDAAFAAGTADLLGGAAGPLRPQLAIVPDTSSEPADPGHVRYSQLSAGSRGRAPEAGGETILYQLTSGSTGPPRVAIIPEGALVRGGDLYASAIRAEPHDQIAVAVPLAHSYGLVGSLFTMLATGAGIVIVDEPGPSALLRAIDDLGATVLFAAPMLYQLLAATGERSRPGLRAAVSSGATMSEDVAAGARASLGTPVVQLYGTTETGLIACQPLDSAVGRDVGPPAPGVEIELVTDHQTGRRLHVRTSTMFRGYVGYDRAAARLRLDGFYDTGDRVLVEPSGSLVVLPRQDTFINVSGNKVNRARIEEVLRSQPGVADAIAYAVPAPFGAGQQAWAAVELIDPACADEALLTAGCRDRLAAFEVPTAIWILPSLPRTYTGKVDVNRLPAPGASQITSEPLGKSP